MALTTMLGTFMEVLDTSVANVALPHMKGTFAAGTDEITWVITSYLVANAIILPITGWLGATFGRRRLYLLCLAIFTLASFGAGAAPNLGFLIFMRVIQGLSGGAMVPMSQAITLEAFPKEEHGMASALFGIGVIFGPIVGPLVGGWITDHWSWPWIFWINLPVGVLAYALAFAFVEDPAYLKPPEGRADLWSLLFIATGLGCLEIFLNRGERLDWLASNPMKVAAGLAALGLALFIWRSFTAERPLVDLGLFRRPEFAAGMLMIFLVSLGMYGAFILVPLFVQNLLGFTPTWAGMILSPGGVATILAMVAVALLMKRVDPRLFVAAGVASMAWSAWLLTRLSLATDLSYLIVAWIFHGLGIGFIFVPVATVAVRRVPPEAMGVASGLFNLMRNEGGSVGIALATTVLSQRVQFHHARLAEHLTATSGPAQEAYARLSHGLFPWAGLDPVSLKGVAAGLLGAEVVRQSAVLAFVDAFAFLAVVFLLALPFALALRAPNGGAEGLVLH
ncbi:MAG TPA: DHA2 family efflux MFS transporter permease subunit [Holophagaceae bacterium]